MSVVIMRTTVAMVAVQAIIAKAVIAKAIIAKAIIAHSPGKQTQETRKKDTCVKGRAVISSPLYSLSLIWHKRATGLTIHEHDDGGSYTQVFLVCTVYNVQCLVFIRVVATEGRSELLL